MVVAKNGPILDGAPANFQENEQLCPSIQLLSETCDDGRVEFSDKVGRDVGAEKSEKGKSVNVANDGDGHMQTPHKFDVLVQKKINQNNKETFYSKNYVHGIIWHPSCTVNGSFMDVKMVPSLS
ncbi:Bpi Fold-Containing Family B Member 2 [Manis pentadactyla]|nr:Bpi Fold-Containing Family B Member 2 [Manis pentadactyla]